jgi:hypothetical protein
MFLSYLEDIGKHVFWFHLIFGSNFIYIFEIISICHCVMCGPYIFYAFAISRNINVQISVINSVPIVNHS